MSGVYVLNAVTNLDHGHLRPIARHPYVRRMTTPSVQARVRCGIMQQEVTVYRTYGGPPYPLPLQMSFQGGSCESEQDVLEVQTHIDVGDGWRLSLQRALRKGVGSREILQRERLSHGHKSMTRAWHLVIFGITFLEEGCAEENFPETGISHKARPGSTLFFTA